MSEQTWPVVIPLSTPIQFGSTVVESLSLRRGKLGDIKGMKLEASMQLDQLLLIASRMSGQPVGVIEMLDVDDAGKVMEIVLDFFGRCLGTGRTA